MHSSENSGLFDLVLAHMTPAILNADCFLRMIHASRGAVFLQKPTRRQSPLLEDLKQLLGIAPGETDPSFAQAFSIAWLLGYSPETRYKEAVWESQMDLEEAENFFSSRLSSYREITPEDRGKIRSFLAARFPDGRVVDETHTHLAALLFRVDQEVPI